MSKSIIFIAALVSIGFLAEAAWAKRISLAGHYSSAQIKSACDKASGNYVEEGGDYGCTTDCKNTGNNNTDTNHCTVTCSSSAGSNCYGYVPGRPAPGATPSIRGVLTGLQRKQVGK